MTPLRTHKIKRVRNRKSKSPKKTTALQNSGSLSRINIANPQVIRELGESVKVVKQRVISNSKKPSRVGDKNTISSLQFQSESELDINGAGATSSGAPTLAAAQARSMSRKPLSKHGGYSNSSKNINYESFGRTKNSHAEIIGIFGDSINQSRAAAPSHQQPQSDHNVLR